MRLPKFLNQQALAWIAPFTMFVIETVIILFQNGNQIYYYMLTVNMAVGFGFLNPGSLLIYILLSDLCMVPLVFIPRIDLLGPQFSFHQEIVSYFVIVFIGLILYVFSRILVRYVINIRKSGLAFDTIMQITPSFMVTIDNNADVEYISDSLLKTFGLPHKQYAQGRPLLDRVPSGEMLMMIQEVLEQDGFVEKNFEIENGDAKYWYMLRSSLMGKDKKSRFFEWADITPIMEAKNEAESAARAKSDFLASISHEIRTPMNAIVWMTDLKLSDELNKEQGDRARTIKGAAFSLLYIINDILDFSKIDAQKMEILIAPFQFATFINNTVNIINIRSSEKGLPFTTAFSKDIPQIIVSDELRLKQTVINILNNAVKFTQEGCINLRAWAEPLEDGNLKLWFSIEDTGIGIKSEDIGRLFEEFHQLDTRRNRELVGTGLGLAISYRLVKLMGGEITVKSEYGKGSTFTFYVACQGSREQKLVSVPAPDELYVLCYEPNHYNALALNQMLDDLGVPHDICGSVGRMKKLLSLCEYTHIFYDGSGTDTVAGYEKTAGTRFVLLREVTEKPPDAMVRSLTRPVLITSLADILSGDQNRPLPRNEERSNSVFIQTQDARVLVVDDNSVNLQVAKGLLGKFGLTVDTATGGMEAIEKIKLQGQQEQYYDIVFMDHMMPGIDGIDATRAVREWEASFRQEPEVFTKGIPIIALTANAVSGMEELFLSSGMDGFLPKPIMIKQLREILLQFLSPEKIVT
jgi:signal transduction histidine kinase/ActR/RegA family two-component response regulator